MNGYKAAFEIAKWIECSKSQEIAKRQLTRQKVAFDSEIKPLLKKIRSKRLRQQIQTILEITDDSQETLEHAIPHFHD